MSLLDDLVSHWKLDEASGTRVDSHGDNDLTDNNTVGQAAGKIGDAAAFVAANSEYLSRTSNASLQAGDADFAIACWLWLDTTADGRGLAGKWLASNQEWILWEAGGNIRFFVSADGSGLTAVSVPEPAAGGWHLLVAWHDSVANTINIQLDNGAVASAAHAGGAFVGSAAFALGTNLDAPTNYGWDGRIDSVSFWKRVLTSDERAALYSAGAGLDYDDFASAEDPVTNMSICLGGPTHRRCILRFRR